MTLRLIIWNLVVFVSILAVLLLANLPWWIVLTGSLAYTVTMLALAYVYNRVWQAVEFKRSVKNKQLVAPPAAWNYYDLVSAVIIGAATGWLAGGADK